MNWVFDIAGLTRQAHSAWINKAVIPKAQTDTKIVIQLARHIRKKHLPGAGVRHIYAFIRNHQQYDKQLIGWSKHSFEQVCFDSGLRVFSNRFIPKTTIHGAYTFDNMIEGITIFGINMIWVSDICYIYGCTGTLIGYATSIIDVYSRYLLGLNFSKTMKAKDTVMPVLKQAFKIRTDESYSGAYFHSDGGKQYIYSEFTKGLRSKNIESSMARNCYENPFAESFNDTLKNHMMHDLKIKNFSVLKRHEGFIKRSYNHNKTHSGIGNLTPATYERKLTNTSLDKRVGLEIKYIE